MDSDYSVNSASRKPEGGGGYRPERPIEAELPPFLRWALPPKAVFKYLFGFPGLLYPWLPLFAGLACISWLLAPGMGAMRSLSADWIVPLLVRNLVLLVAFVGIAHLLMYVRRTQGTSYKYNSKW